MNHETTTLSSVAGHLNLDSVGGFLNYLWLAGVYWVQQLRKELQGLHSKTQNLEKELATRPTVREVSIEVGEEIAKVERHLERIESLLWSIHQRKGEEK